MVYDVIVVIQNIPNVGRFFGWTGNSGEWLMKSGGRSETGGDNAVLSLKTVE